jgi:hypothetical protein
MESKARKISLTQYASRTGRGGGCLLQSQLRVYFPLNESFEAVDPGSS